MTKPLTKIYLVKHGITNIEFTPNNELKIYKKSYLKRYKQYVEMCVPVHDVTTKHKYGTDKTYKAVTWYYNGKPYSVSLARLLYAWFLGDIPEGYDVDHIDNNPNNNNLDNLKLLTREENLRKRYSDNPNGFKCNKTCIAVLSD